MKHFFIAFVLFCTWLYLGIQYYECKVKNLCNDVIVTTEEPKKIPPKPIEKPLTYLPFFIKKNVAKVSIIDSTSNPLQKFYDRLNNNQKEELVITTFFSKDENGSIALSRGDSARKALIDFGINTDRIVMQTKQVELQFSEKAQSSKGFTYEFQTMSEERMKAIDKGIASKILYAGFGSKTFKPDNTLNAYTLELKNYLAKYPTKKVQIIGHTDSSGDAEANLWFGKERAKSVMKYFISQDIDASKLAISSKGENEPIAPNNTMEGQRLNRRIEINITN